MDELFVDTVESFPCILLSAVQFHYLVTAIVLIHESVHASKFRLLYAEIFLTDPHQYVHDDETYCRRDCGQHRKFRACIQHHDECTDDGDGGDDKMRHTLAATLSHSVRIVGDAAHDVSAGAVIEIRYVYRIQLIGEVFTHLPCDILRGCAYYVMFYRG